MDQDETCLQVGLSPGHIVLDRDPADRQKGHSLRASPNFQPMSIVAKWLDGLRCHGVEVGLGPGDIVLDRHPSPAKKEHSPPH